LFLKQEKSEMDDLKKQTLVLKEKYLEYYFSILHDFLKMFSSFELYPCKNVTKYLCIFLVSELSFYFRKNLHPCTLGKANQFFKSMCRQKTENTEKMLVYFLKKSYLSCISEWSKTFF